MKVLPEKFLRLMSKEDRKSLGKAGMTAEEALAKFVCHSERDLQRTIVQLLRQKGIEPLWHRTDKRSAATVGWPDITFAVQRDWQGVPVYLHRPVIACAWEVKFGNGELSKEQKQMAIRLQSPPNCWRWRCIRSVDDALKELKEMDQR